MPAGTGFDDGNLFPSTLPAWQRTYYEMQLLETLRMNSILVPFTIMKEDFNAVKTGQIVYSEVYDMEPNWNALGETTLWLQGGALDSRTITINLEIHGDMLKFHDYNEIVQYINRGDIRGLVRNKIGQDLIDTNDILARNAFLSTAVKSFGGDATSRITLDATDLFDPDLAEVIRVHLEENEVPGVATVGDGDGAVIVCVTTPRVIKDIRTAAGSKWLEVQEYAGSVRKFRSEVGMWAGVRFIKTMRNMLRNHGAVATQTTLAAPTVSGQGSAATVDQVYAPGQPSSTRYITVASSAGFVAGDHITLHDVTLNGGAGNPPIETDGTQETRRIIEVDPGGANTLSLNKPLLKPHANGDLVTNGLDVHASMFMGGPGVVYAVGERPRPVIPPKFDDLMIINRIGWRGYYKFQLFRPEFFEVVESAGSTD